MPITPGQIIGDYEVLGQIGVGGMSEVYKVRNVISERIDAMKVLRPQEEDTPDAAGRFLREIKVQASLKHPNIADLHTAMRLDDQILMFMELLDGMDVREKLRHCGSLSSADAVNYCSQCLEALDYAHRRGVVHRDIKPSNLIVSENGVVKLVDFGIARSTKDLSFTGTGMAIGSAHYMSPEQALGHEVDHRSDLYSVGVMLYEMLMGARPFGGDSSFAILKAHVEQEPLSPCEWKPDLPPFLCDAVLRALSKNREDRFPSAAAFRAAIEDRDFVEPPTIPPTKPVKKDPTTTVAAPVAPTEIDSSVSARVAALLAAEVGPMAAYLVKQANAQAKDIRELCALAAQQVSDETGRKRFLARCGSELQLTPSDHQPQTKGTGPTSGARQAAWDPAVLDRAKRALAEYVGPLAKILVDNASRKCTNIHELYGMLAEQVDSPADRAKFLASKPQS